MKRPLLSAVCFLAFLAAVTVFFSAHLYQNSCAVSLTSINFGKDEFRAMQFSERMLPVLRAWSKETSMPTGEILTVLAPFSQLRYLQDCGFCASDLIRWKEILIRSNRSGFLRVSDAYGAIWDDLACFPVAGADISYENSWMFERTYGGLRGHEGTDLMPPENIPGHYRIVSMTDGVVEKIGWLPKGGYRIGIRSPSGGYFYYAHLDSYSHSFYPGEPVEAGTLLGWMGDTGYGPEGTHGKFRVHLHLGIYLGSEETGEISVNPYWVLRYLDGK